MKENNCSLKFAKILPQTNFISVLATHSFFKTLIIYKKFNVGLKK